MTSVIGIGIALGLIGIGAIGMLVAGIKSLASGKQDLKKIITFIIPFIVFGVAYGMTGTLNEAGIATMLFLIAAMALLILFTGFKSTFNL